MSFAFTVFGREDQFPLRGQHPLLKCLDQEIRYRKLPFFIVLGCKPPRLPHVEKRVREIQGIPLRIHHFLFPRPCTREELKQELQKSFMAWPSNPWPCLG